MSRMVRENLSSGLQERVWFARWSLRELQQRQQAGENRGPLLALRAAVISHSYSVLIGLSRFALQQAAVPLSPDALTLAALEQAAEEHGVVSPQVELLRQARSQVQDKVCWLEGEFRALFAANGLSRRPQPPQVMELRAAQDNADDVLAAGDLQRLQQMIERVEALLTLASGQLEEC